MSSQFLKYKEFQSIETGLFIVNNLADRTNVVKNPEDAFECTCCEAGAEMLKIFLC